MMVGSAQQAMLCTTFDKLPQRVTTPYRTLRIPSLAVSSGQVTYAYLLNALGLDAAIQCAGVEPGYERVWRSYALWCAQQVQHLVTNQDALDAMSVAERYVQGLATIRELRSAFSDSGMSVIRQYNAQGNIVSAEHLSNAAAAATTEPSYVLSMELTTGLSRHVIKSHEQEEAFRHFISAG